MLGGQRVGETCRDFLRDEGICLGCLFCMVPPTLVIHFWVKIRCFGDLALFGSMGAAAIERMTNVLASRDFLAVVGKLTCGGGVGLLVVVVF